MTTTTKETQMAGLRFLLSATAKYIIGIDEVGLGAWAGPLVVSGMVMPKGWGHPDVKDSKKVPTHDKRTKILHEIIQPNETWEMTVTVPSETIDKIGVGNALSSSFLKIASECKQLYPDSIIVLDGNQKLSNNKIGAVLSMPKADDLVPAVSAASILAKVTRDNMMRQQDKQYPGYNFGKNSGYGTKEHRNALELLGPCAIHRRSYAPIALLLEN